jgi:hypothetical protein
MLRRHIFRFLAAAPAAAAAPTAPNRDDPQLKAIANKLDMILKALTEGNQALAKKLDAMEQEIAGIDLRVHNF